MNNTRTIAALERSIAQLTAIKDRLTAAEAKAFGGTAKKSGTKKLAAKRTMTPEHKASISAAQRRRHALTKSPAKKRAAEERA